MSKWPISVEKMIDKLIIKLFCDATSNCVTSKTYSDMIASNCTY